MKLLVGLGNPGPQYETTRHNAGFLMLDQIVEIGGGSYEEGKGGTGKFGGVIGKGTVLGQTCIFLKPMTFMNKSGRSVAEVLRFFKVTAKDMVVLFDDLDVPAGSVKAREGGGHGGHNGVRSIMEDAGVTEFHRIKLGIGRPPYPGDAAVTSWVLGKMTDAELLVLQNEMLKDTMTRLKGIFDKSLAGK